MGVTRDASVEHLAGVANDRVEFLGRERADERRHRVPSVRDQRPLVGGVRVLRRDLTAGQFRPRATTTVGAVAVRAAALVDLAPEHERRIGRSVGPDGNLWYIARACAQHEDRTDQHGGGPCTPSARRGGRSHERARY